MHEMFVCLYPGGDDFWGVITNIEKIYFYFNYLSNITCLKNMNRVNVSKFIICLKSLLTFLLLI